LWQKCKKIRYSNGGRFGTLPFMKLKKSSNVVAEENVPAAGGAFISARLRNPADEVAAAQGKGGSDMVAGIFAIVATVLMAVITALLYFNWDAIKSA